MPKTNRYFVTTDEGLELIDVKAKVKFVPYPNGKEFRVTYSDGSGFDVYSYCHHDSDAKTLRQFLVDNLDR